MQRKKKYDVNQGTNEPDNELLVWEKWINIRKEEVSNLAQQLDKQPVDLTMNLLEKVREEKEWKTALEYAKIDKKPKIRGNLIEQPHRLKQSCYCKPVYEQQRTLAEMGKPAVIEHISVPEYIQKVEKGLSGVPERPQCKRLDAEFVKYRKKREDDLKEKILKIDPFRPQASELMVRGRKPKTRSPKMPLVPDIEITPMAENPLSEEIPVYAIRINNTVILKDIPDQSLSFLEKLKEEEWHESCTTWFYYIKTPVKRAGRCKLFLQNLGTVALRYCWKKIKRSIPFIPEDIYEQVFFFNKNEDVLSPGQSKEIFFTFLSDKPGIYCESWEINFCNICFYDKLSDKLCVNLSADSVENAQKIRKQFEILKARIERKAIYNTVIDIILDVITKVTTVEPQQYPYKHLFLEAELFVMKNPVCFYHQTEVNKLRNLYSEMVPDKKWDLSIKSWREAMVAQEFDERMKYYELLKHSHTELLKPWYEGEGLLKQKYLAMKMLLGQMADEFDKKFYELVQLYYPPPVQDQEERVHDKSMGDMQTSNEIDPLVYQTVYNLFYIHAYHSVSSTIEMCAGVLSSLDLNKWIEFDFCRL